LFYQCCFNLIFPAEKKKLELAEKFRELKKSGKLDKYLNRKRKKTASKDRKNLPKINLR
jgi:ribosomal RNA-processing protein 36